MDIILLAFLVAPVEDLSLILLPELLLYVRPDLQHLLQLHLLDHVLRQLPGLRRPPSLLVLLGLVVELEHLDFLFEIWIIPWNLEGLLFAATIGDSLRFHVLDLLCFRTISTFSKPIKPVSISALLRRLFRHLWALLLFLVDSEYLRIADGQLLYFHCFFSQSLLIPGFPLNQKPLRMQELPHAVRQSIMCIQALILPLIPYLSLHLQLILIECGIFSTYGFVLGFIGISTHF